MFAATLIALNFSAVSFAQNAPGKTCAMVYQSENFSGQQLVIGDGYQIANLERVPFGGYSDSWQNRISSAYVSQGCTLVLFQYFNFEGQTVSLANRYPTTQRPVGGQYTALGGFDNLASSLICSCAQ